MVEWRSWRGLALHPMRPRQGRPVAAQRPRRVRALRARRASPDGAETPPRRQPWSHGEAVEKILEAIPCDRWVSAAEIAAETGISSSRVGALIRRHLLNADVERRPTGPSGCSFYLYRRLHRVGKTKSSRGTLIQLGNTISSWRGE